MPRRARITKREIRPDPKYNNVIIAMMINKIMVCGKKSIAETIMYSALQIIEQQEAKEPVSVFEQALKNATPLLQVKPRRVGGATYQVPVEIQPERAQSLAIRWLLKSARARNGKTMAEKLAAEITDASKQQGATVKRREDTHKMAEANRAFAHYKW